MENSIYSWIFEDKKNRSTTWYVIFLSIMLGLVVWWFLTKQYWMSFVIILLSWLMYFMENNSDDQVEIVITDLWIRVAETFYDYWKISDFWILYNGENAIALRLKIIKKSINQIDLDLNNEIASDVRVILSEYLVENPNVEMTFIERLVKILKL